VPELPDLEVAKDVLTPRIVGRTVRGVEASHADLARTGEGSVASLKCGGVRSLARRGEYLVFSIGDVHLVVGLGRWAWLWHGPGEYPPTTATRFRIAFDDGTDLRLIEGKVPPRAAVWVVADPGRSEPLTGLGWEPLSPEFTPEVLRGLLAGRRRTLKELLTDRSLIAGIGDAYADEILFTARLSPVRFAHTLTPEEVHRLWEATQSTLRWAIGEIRARVGDALVEREVRDFLRVHGRAGAPCPACGAAIAEFRFDDARTGYCPRCQRG